MHLEVYPNKATLAEAVAAKARTLLIKTIARKGHARLIAATGASQLDMLAVLTGLPGIAWDKVEMFHLDEYAGLGEDHPASFARYLRERLVNKVGIRKFHLIDGTRDPQQMIAELDREVQSDAIDLAFAGIGENGHLAFNDPPADFETERPYLVVPLDEDCRRQQLGEGWFATLNDVPRQAISMSIRQILKSEHILASVPDMRKAKAVRECMEGDITPMHPSSILRNHPNTIVYLDADSASQLAHETLARYASAN